MAQGPCRAPAPLKTPANAMEKQPHSLAPDADEQRDRTWGAAFLLGLTILTFAGQLMAFYSRTASAGVPLLSGLHEIDLMRFGAMPVDVDAVAREPWLLLSCVFVHFGIIHIGLNMMGLWGFTRVTEPAIGPARVVIAYVLSGIAGSVLTLVLSAVDAPGILGQLQRLILARPRGVFVVATTAGASGAVFGLMGLELGLLIRRRDSRWKAFAVEAVVFAVLFGFVVNTFPASKIAVNNAAHLGGLVSGVAFGLAFAGPRRWAPPWLGRGAAALCLLASVASLILAQLSPRWRTLDRTLTSLPGAATYAAGPSPSAVTR